MNSSTLMFVIAFGALFSYWFAIRHAIIAAGGRSKVKTLTSLPRQFGLLTAFWCVIPALLFLLLWTFFESTLIKHLLLMHLPDSVSSLSGSQLSLYLNNIQLLAASGEVLSDLKATEDALQLQTAGYLREITTNVVLKRYR